jgi:hypothetical protein
MGMSRQEIARELNKIATAHGGHATAEQVVAAAAPADHALHLQFEWDDGAAGHQWRVRQARTLLRVTVYMRKPDDGRVRIPVFTSLPSDRGTNGYRRTEDVRADPDMSLEHDLDVLRRVEAILSRANSPRLDEILNQIARTIAHLEQETAPEMAE